MATAAATLTAGSSGAAPGAAAAAGGNGGGAGAPANGGGAAATSSWWDGVKDAGTKDWLKTKNFPDSDSALTGYRNLESLFGADKANRTLMLPKDDNDAEGWANVAKRLGVPEKADGYKLQVPEGGDASFAQTAAEWFREAGVPPRAASLINTKWNEFVKTQVEAGEAAERVESEKQMEALGREWGSNFDANRELAQRGYRSFAERFGLDDKAALARAESVLGAANLTKFFAGLGTLDGEAAFAGKDGKGGFNMSASAAQQEINDIQAKRNKGDINDHQWRTHYQARVMELGRVVTKSLNAQ